MGKSNYRSLFGESLVVDLIDCNRELFTRPAIARFCERLCDGIDMQREALHFWDYEDAPEEYERAPDHLKGMTAVQFISTSALVIHTLDVTGQVFVDVFSCKPFDHDAAAKIVAEFFRGTINAQHSLTRG